jgi:antitoxin YefM
MDHVTYTDLRQNLARYLDQAADSRAPILVTRQRGKPNVVIVAAEEWAGWQETVHLLGNPANAAHVLNSVQQADAGQVRERELIPAKRTTKA